MPHYIKKLKGKNYLPWVCSSILVIKYLNYMLENNQKAYKYIFGTLSMFSGCLSDKVNSIITVDLAVRLKLTIYS